MKRVVLSALLLTGVIAFAVIAAGSSNNSAAGTYKIQLDNAFGLVTGADFKVAGVSAGTIKSIDLPSACVKGNPRECYAQVTVEVTQSGFGEFRSDAFCQSRPQSLIGEYFVDCQPGHTGKVLKPGSTIPVSQTQSTIPADLLTNIMRMPYRERFSLIINELGAAVAGRSQDLQAALHRAVPALDETDNLLNMLANDSHTLQQLTTNSDQVISALADNSRGLERFIDEAGRLSVHTANQAANLQGTFQRLPAFLEQLRPAMANLSATVTANQPVLVNLRAASSELNRLFTNLPAFSRASLPALKSLGKASVTGKQAVNAAGPTIKNLNQFAKPAPELAQNLAIVGHDLDDRSRAVEPDTRSPGGKGYTGLEAVLQYVFNQTLAINQFGQFGHFLTVDAFIDPRCAPYATPNIGNDSITNNLKRYGPTYRQCYAWLGPNQPGVNETDPTNPTACVPDPGGAPPGERGPSTSATKCTTPVQSQSSDTGRSVSTSNNTSSNGSSAASGAHGSQAAGARGARGGGPLNLGGTINQIVGSVLGSAPAAGTAPASSATKAAGGGATAAKGASSPGAAAADSGGSGSGAQTQQLLNYLLAP